MSTKQVTVRIPEPLLRDIEFHQARLQAHAGPGKHVSRTDAVVNLIALGIQEALSINLDGDAPSAGAPGGATITGGP